MPLIPLLLQDSDMESDAFGMKPRFVANTAKKKMCIRDIRRNADLKKEKYINVASPQEAAWHAKQAALVAAKEIHAASDAMDPIVIKNALANAVEAVEAAASAAAAAIEYPY